MLLILTLCCVSFLAGLVDSIVGGGGLIQIPILFVMLPGVAPGAIFGTNKLAMIAGTSVAFLRFVRQVPIPWASALPAAGVAAIGAFFGANAVTLMDPETIRPMVLGLLVLVAIYTYRKKDFGVTTPRTHSTRRSATYGAIIGLVLGFYDGFFGPGTGSFLIFAFVSVLGFEFLIASACAKLVNVFTNLTPILHFGSQGQIFYHLALPMAVCNILGSVVGTHLAFARGSVFVRRFFLAVIALVIIRFAWDVFGN